jgi:alpha-2-macroglobulin
VDALRRLKRPDPAAENELIRQAAQMRAEDRLLLAEVLARRGDRSGLAAARQLLEPAWRSVKMEGKRASLPDATGEDFYFSSRLRPTARLLRATLAVEPAHPLLIPLVETMVQQGRAEARYPWNTQDYGQVVLALAEMELRQRSAAERTVRVRAGGRVLYEGPARGGALRDSGIVLGDMLGRAGADGARPLRLALDSRTPGAPVFFYATINEIPLKTPVTPDDQGIRVERWYERFDARDRSPIISATEGELVRVRLRITVPEDRQFVVLDDPLPAGLEAVDLSLRTATTMPGPGAVTDESRMQNDGQTDDNDRAWYGSWDAGWWSPFDHKEMRDDRVVYFATTLWKGTYTATYVARATTPGVFVRPPAHAEEMYNRAVQGRSDGGVFTVRARGR